MRRILVPTDFSENALEAAVYAAKIAKRKGCKLEVCHAFKTFYSGFQAGDVNRKQNRIAIAEAKMKLNGFIEQLRRKSPAVPISTHVADGATAAAVLSQAKKLKCDMIIMGTKGSSGLKRIFFGSNTFEVIKNSTIPVMAVPPGHSNAKWRKAAFATNYKSEDIKALRQAIKMLSETDLKLTIFHLYNGNKKTEEEKWLKWWKQIQAKVKGASLQFELQKSDDFLAGIKKLLRKHKADLLIMPSNYHTNGNRFLSGDLLQSVSYRPEIPLLVIP